MVATLTAAVFGVVGWYLLEPRPTRSAAPASPQASAPVASEPIRQVAPSARARAETSAFQPRVAAGWTPRAGEVEPPPGVDVDPSPKGRETLAGGLTVVAREVVLKFKEGLTPDAMRAFHAEHGTSVVYVAPTGFRRVKLREGVSVPEALARLGKDGRVALVSANVNVR